MPSQPKPKKMGRPVLPKEHAKNERLQVRLTATERRKILAAAKASKQSESDWVRSTLIAAAEG
jgi:uncharacterized protein (DUF1778 family)